MRLDEAADLTLREQGLSPVPGAAMRGPEPPSLLRSDIQRAKRRSALQQARRRAENSHEPEKRTDPGEAEDYRKLFDDAPIGLFQLEPDGRPLRVNRRMAEICGFPTTEEFLDEVACVATQLFDDASFWSGLMPQLARGSQPHCIETKIRRPDGELKWVQLNIRAVRGDHQPVLFYEGSAEDIDERRTAEERVQWLAYHDTLTSLPNRSHFREKLAEALVAARRKDGKVAVLLLELERFKVLNDSLGEAFGDRLLQGIADRLRACVGDQGIVARMWGAEFGVILPEVADGRSVAETAQALIAATGAEFSFMGHSLNVSCHVGISIFPDDGADGEVLVKRADLAMYSAQEQGPDEMQFFTESMNLRVLLRLKLENGLRLASDRGELFLEYQPQVDIRTGAVMGLEALLRWQHPDLGLVSPASFIGVAERSGLIVPIGEWVLRTACRQLRQWQEEGLPAVPIAVNVSAFQFRRRDFCAVVRRILEETGLPPQYLELELTEGLLLTDAEVIFATLRELRQMGVRLAIDDFGTGYCSLGYLRQFQVNRLKIDRSFVRDVSSSADSAAIATAIIRMAKALNLAVLAEGVETEDQLAFLRHHDCYEIQGFYFSKPVPVERAGQQLRTRFLR